MFYEQKRDKVELERLLKLYHAIVESPMMVMVTDPEGRIEFVNSKFSEVTGYAITEVLGRNPRLLRSGKTPSESYQDLWETIAGGKEWHGEFINRKKGGELYHESASIAPVLDHGGISHFVAVKEDITDRKRAVEALQESEAVFRVMFDQANQLMGLMKPDGTLIKMNRAAAGLIDIEEADVIGNPFWDAPWWAHSPEQQERVKEAVKAAAGGETVRFEATHPAPDGTFMWVDFSLKPVRDDEGRVIYLIPEGRNITDDKKAKERVESLNIELAARNRDLEAANRELNTFNYSVSHDLRAPLSIIGGYAELIRDRCGHIIDRKGKEYLAAIAEGVSRMTHLIDVLLDFSSVARRELQWQEVNLSAMVREVTYGYRLAEPERRVTFRIAGDVKVAGDPSLLRMVLTNILGNAWKFTSRQEEALIEFGVTTVEGEKACFIRDNGPGFDMAEAGKLFLPFQRLSPTKEIFGHGIGLATVERIITRHHGKLWVQAEPGEGATFFFTLGGDRGETS